MCLECVGLKIGLGGWLGSFLGIKSNMGNTLETYINQEKQLFLDTKNTLVLRLRNVILDIGSCYCFRYLKCVLVV